MSGNINNIYKYTGKFYYRHQYKTILEVDIVSIPEVLTDNSPISAGLSVTVKTPCAIKSLRQFSGVLDSRQKTAVCRLSSAKFR